MDHPFGFNNVSFNQPHVPGLSLILLAKMEKLGPQETILYIVEEVDPNEGKKKSMAEIKFPTEMEGGYWLMTEIKFLRSCIMPLSPLEAKNRMMLCAGPHILVAIGNLESYLMHLKTHSSMK